MKHLKFAPRVTRVSIIAIFVFAFASAAAHAETTNVAPALSFKEAYERIIDRNLDVQNQQLNIERSQAAHLGAIGAFTPSLNLVAGETREAAQDIFPSSGRRAAVVALGANLFKSGTDFAALKGAVRDVEASEEVLKNEKLRAEDDAATTLINFISRTRERELISQIVTLKSEGLKIARERYSRGLLAQQEVSKTQIDLDNAQARLIDADLNVAATRAAVSAKLGAFQNVNLDWPWKSALVMGPKAETFEFKLENRPDYRASLKTIEAQDWRRHAARSLLLPSLDLYAAYGINDLNQTGRRDWSANLTLTIPIFERFQGYSAARTQTLIKQQAEIARESITRSALTEIESNRVGFSVARDSAVAREKTAILTRSLFTDNLQRFRLGRASANELAIDQQRLLEAQLLEVEGWATAHLSFVRLCHALGRNALSDGSCQ